MGCRKYSPSLPWGCWQQLLGHSEGQAQPLLSGVWGRTWGRVEAAGLSCSGAQLDAMHRGHCKGPHFFGFGALACPPAHLAQPTLASFQVAAPRGRVLAFFHSLYSFLGPPRLTSQERKSEENGCRCTP